MKMITAVFVLLMPTLTHAWDGYDYEKGSYVAIPSPNVKNDSFL